MKKNLTNKTNRPQAAIKGAYRRLRAGLLLLLLLPALGKAQYCNSNFTSVSFEYIKNVTFAGINNSSAGTLGGPVNYTTQVANVVSGNAYNMNITIDDDALDYIYVFIDWNQNSILNDAGETYTIAGPVGTASGNMVLPTYVITVPALALQGTTRMRVMLDYNGPTANPCRNATWGEAEDYSVNVIIPTPCGTTPASNTIVGPTASICPGTSVNLSLANSYTFTGITYLWQSSTTGTNSGWTAVPGGTTTSLTTPTLGVNTWYQTIITCANTGGSITVISNPVQVMQTTTNTVPYFEGFEGIQGTNGMPNCSWSATNLNTSSFTYSVPQNGQNRIPHTGNAFASFYYLPAQTSDFYSNGVWFDAGVTYSANIWFTTDGFGYNIWEFNLNYGPSQNQTGTVSIISAKPAISGAYKMLNNTFQVATSGLYYLNVQAKSNGNCCGANLSWDDLEITIPCSLNSPTVGISANNTTVCAGQPVILTATGADTYVWNTGDNTSAITKTPMYSTVYNVAGTNTLSGCSVTMSQPVTVNPSPAMGLIATPATVCAGKPVTLSAYGADTYTWSSGGNGASRVEIPVGPTSYTVLGTNIYSCTGSAIQAVNVNANPSVSVAPSTTAIICAGESVTLTGTGAGTVGTYVWKATTAFVSFNPLIVSPNASTSYTVDGTDGNGCVGSFIYALGVDACLGVKESSLNGMVSAYPNPTSGQFTIEMNDNSSKSVMVTDVMGRVISVTNTSNTKVNIDLTASANGIYYVKVKSGNALEIIKVVKQ